MIFNFSESSQLSIGTWLGVLWHGMRLDFSAGAYLLAIPLLIMSFLCFFEMRYTKSFIKLYNYLFLFIVLFLGVTDMDIYSYWGFKLDITPLVYLKTPKEATASLNLIEISLLITFFLLLYFLALKVFRRYIFSQLNRSSESSRPFSIVGIVLLGLLIIPIRGGIGIAPINLGSAYFHTNRFANHSAVNVLWNTVYSFVERKSLITSFNFMEKEKADELFKNFYPPPTKNIHVIKKNSNVILIILESFSNKIIGELGGEPGITPEMDTLCRNSLVFRNFFASGDRSEKGILSLMSGYPAQPTTTIINFPGKTQGLPFLLSPFHENGYYTAFYYGGDFNFANFRSYFTNPWMDRQISINNFPSKLNTQKWGVPDEFLFEKMINDIDTIKSPFFISCFTLSSHEPYDISMELVFPSKSRNDMSKNAFHYTDKCVGEFIDQAKKRAWWDNTLIIIVADHGSRYPGNTPNDVALKFRIPMIWTGGAVTISDTSINKYASQTDLPVTLLNQFEFPLKGYIFSKDILDANSKSFAMYFFNNGFGYMSDSMQAIYDNTIKCFTYTSGVISEEFKESSKAYLQVLSNDFYVR
jgi:phosphoglycerol transferase MdoB-like AlkP superfamily enzyme